MAEFFSSASQVDTYEECPRKWGFKRLDRIRVAPNASAALGSATHSQLENWLREKKAPDLKSKEGKLAHALIPHLPAPQMVDPTNVEIKSKLQLGGVSFVLVIDLWMPTGFERPKNYDHKTTSDFQWAKSADDLLRDVQGTLYAAWALEVSKAEAIDMQWNYVRTKGAAKTLPVIVENVTGRQISERVSKTIETAKETQEIYQAHPKALELPHNAEACENYGGCPFKDRCNLTAKERLRSIMSQKGKTMGFAEKLAAKKEAAKKTGPSKAKAKEEGPQINPPEQADEEGAVEATEEQPKAAKTRGRGRPKGATKGFTLYVNCAPIGQSVELASVRIEELMVQLREEGDEVRHYKEVEYGKGVGTFSEALRQNLKDSPPKLPIVLYTSSFEQADMLQTFMAAASLVVR